jgi:hypothetical protein
MKTIRRDGGARSLCDIRVGTLGRSLGGAVALLLTLAAPAWAGDEVLAGLALTSEARDLPITYRKRSNTAAKVESKLSPEVRAALNDWADLITELDLSLAVPEHASALVLGRASKKTLIEAAAVLDDSWELLEPLREVSDGEGAVVVSLLLDREALESELWGQLLEALGERKLLSKPAVDNLGRDRGGVTVRERGLFLQPTYDMAGSAADGDDEFRLGNEVAHKFNVCWLRMNFGEVPSSVRWGFGYLAEQRLFQSIYQFNAVGFVASVDHFGWPKRTAKALDAYRKSKTLEVGGAIMTQTNSGGPGTEQMISWGALDYLLMKEPERLADLLKGLGELHAEAAGWRSLPNFVGDLEQARQLLDVALDGVDARKLQKHVKRVK